MKYIKFRAFTLAEVMILLLTLSILMAAFAPVFTRRYSNASTDDVWAFVSGDDEGNAYFDTPNKNYTAQAFIGLTPVDGAAVRTFSSDASNNVLYSKIVVGASDRLGGASACGSTHECQKQIQFRYGNDQKGTAVGALFAGRGNVLLGGLYKNITSTASANAGYGKGVLNDITSGYNNAAIGYNALQKLTKGHDNTALGLAAGGGVTEGNSNTFVGLNAGSSVGSKVGYTTAVGISAAKGVTGYGNTAVGFNAMSQGNGAAEYNTAIGYYSLASVTSGKGNTAVGYNSLSNVESGSYNTAIGYNSCNEVKNGGYKTCIGYNAGSNSNSKSSLYTGDYERVFIGSSPVNSVDNSSGTKDDGYPTTEAGGVLEVYNLNSHTDSAAPISKIGNSAVVINGNLIVRGNSYFEIPIMRQTTAVALGKSGDPGKSAQKGLVLYTLFNEKIGNVFGGYDGYGRNGGSSYEGCRCRRRHQFPDIRPSCVCTAVSYTSAGTYGSDSYSHTNTRTTNYQKTADGFPVSTSYDWFTKARNDNAVARCSATSDGNNGFSYRFHVGKGNCKDCGTYYFDRSIASYPDYPDYAEVISQINSNSSTGDSNAANVWFERRHSTDSPYNYAMPGVDMPYSHARQNTSGTEFADNMSCCPVLIREDDAIFTGTKNVLTERSSDARLKNVGGKFVAGLDEIRRLSVYNYTFKNDENKLPHVGVIAQDLRLIFPNAVTKDENGYYQIRLDEMLYAAINAIKTLNTKVQNVAAKIAKDKQRVAQLKKDNTELNAKLDSLAEELTKLEAGKK